MSCPDLNCTWTSDEWIPFDADPDIAGTGVVLALIISAYFAYAVSVGTFLFLNDNEDSIPRNLFDKTFIRAAQILVPKFDHSRAQVAMRELSAGLSDQFLVTSASILVVGFAQHCTITQYHFVIVTYLAWLVLSALEASITTAEDEYRGNLVLRIWRTIWIGVLYVLLLVGNAVTYNNAFLWQYGESTQCVWNVMVGSTTYDPRNTGGYFAPPGYPSKWAWLMAVNDLLLIWSLATTIWKLWDMKNLTFWIKFRRSFASYHPINWLPVSSWTKPDRTTGPVSSTKTRKISQPCIYLLSTLATTLIQFLTCSLLAKIRILGQMYYCTRAIMSTRSAAKGNGMNGREDKWGFGQILPLLMLALLVTSMMATFQKKSEDTEDSAQGFARLASESTSKTRTFPLSPVSRVAKLSLGEALTTSRVKALEEDFGIARPRRTKTVMMEEGKTPSSVTENSSKSPTASPHQNLIDFEEMLDRQWWSKFWLVAVAVGGCYASFAVVDKYLLDA